MQSKSAFKYNSMYQLSQAAIKSINEARANGIIRQVAFVLDRSESQVNKLIRDNEINGDLTKKAALEVIQRITRLKLSDILVGSKVQIIKPVAA